MIEFKIGDYVEVGIGDSVHDEDGYSCYFMMDVDGYNESDIMDIFEKEGNVLYVQEVNDESSIIFAGDSKFSDYLEDKRTKKYVKIELEVELPVGYNESKIDNVLADAIYSFGGQVLNSKEYKEIIPSNI